MKKILFFQAPDYRDIYYSFENGEPEKYAFQKQLTQLSASFLNRYGISDICVISLFASDCYDEVLSNAVRAVGLPIARLGKRQVLKKCKEFIKEYSPENCIIQVPVIDLIKYCSQAKIKSLVMIADSFTGSGLIGFIRCRLFASILNNSFIEVVTNHNYPASRLLRRFGVNPSKIVPWDHPWDISVYKTKCKRLDQDKKNWNFFYAGRVIKAKGVGEIIGAVSLLRKQGYAAKAVIAGDGDIALYKRQADDLNVSENISFLGNIPHEEVVNYMRKSDAVIVPSRINASEGMPCTIYESLLVKTPLVLSNHPMFKEAVKNGVFFESADAKSLAQALVSLMSDMKLYNKLSEDSDKALRQLIVPFCFSDIIEHWIAGTEKDKKWLKERSLENIKDNSRNLKQV